MIANPWENPSIRILGYGYLDLDTILTIQHLDTWIFGYLKLCSIRILGYINFFV